VDFKHSLEGKTVLVIDDEKAVRDSTSALLQSWGMRVLSADGIEQAENHVASGENQVDVILADFRLRDGVTGSMVIKNLRQLSGADIPGVIITGDTAPERIREARESGCTLLHKPIKPGQLRTVLGKFCCGPATRAALGAQPL
jgi:CheY-like chemotaxis protein